MAKQATGAPTPAPRDSSVDAAAAWAATVQAHHNAQVRCGMAIEKAIDELAEWQCAPLFDINNVRTWFAAREKRKRHTAAAEVPRPVAELRDFVRHRRPWLLTIGDTLLANVAPRLQQIVSIYPAGWVAEINRGPGRFNGTVGERRPLRRTCEADLVVLLFRDVLAVVDATVGIFNEEPDVHRLGLLVENLGQFPLVDHEELAARVIAELQRAFAAPGSLPTVKHSLNRSEFYKLSRIAKEFNIPNDVWEQLRGRLRRATQGKPGSVERLSETGPREERTQYHWGIVEEAVVSLVTELHSHAC